MKNKMFKGIFDSVHLRGISRPPTKGVLRNLLWCEIGLLNISLVLVKFYNNSFGLTSKLLDGLLVQNAGC